ncbi:hypothetical protein [Actinomadura rugatobispora]|uniref:SRPBCC family protein n=1 Tax=Actinomadura rugatobispora TaxID=1994 RepID=A0ABW1A2Z2_9ACTN|nr:SRPBCC family protein [Actinomadura rugatobispora]
MEYEAERPMPADSRTVFQVAADVWAMRHWIPEDVVLRPLADDLVEVRGRDRVLLRRVPDQLRLEWGILARPDYTGWLQVLDRADGRSSVLAHLSFLGDQPQNTGSKRVRAETQRLLEESLGRLAEEVTRRSVRT